MENSRTKNKNHKTKKHQKHHNKRRNHKKTYKGGFGPGACPVGFPWQAGNIGSWPGVAGVPGQSNYLELSKVGVPAGPFDPPLSSRLMNGGGLIPQDLVNIGRDFMYNVNSAYNAFNGYKAPVNPSPYVQNPSV